MPRDCLDELNSKLLAFARERDWEQFHSPKNLSMALAGEAGELLEHFNGSAKKPVPGSRSRRKIRWQWRWPTS